MFTQTKTLGFKHKFKFEPPSLIEIQLKSFDWFLKEGLREIFQEIFPVKDYTGEQLQLDFLNYFLDEAKIDEERAKEKELSYEAPLRIKLRLKNLKTKKISDQEVYFGDIPIMTPRGTFIVNGIERVVISQLIRSPGVFFVARKFKGFNLFGAKIIPYRGSWLELEVETDKSIYVKIDRKRRIAISALLRIFGLETDDAIKAKFKDLGDSGLKYIEKTLAIDTTKTSEEAYIEIYKRLRVGELATLDNAKSLIDASFFREDRYDLSRIGRFKINQRLEIKDNQPNVKSRILTLQDLALIIKELIKLNMDTGAQPDDIDHLSNRRLRTMGELLQNRVRIGLARVRRAIQDKMAMSDIHSVTPGQLIYSKPFISAVREFFASFPLSQFMDQVNPLSELEQKRRISAMGPGGLVRERAGFEVRDVHPSYYGRICPIQTPEGPNVGLVGHLTVCSRVNDLGFMETPYFKVKNGKLTSEVVYMDAWEEEKYKIAHVNTLLDSIGRITEKVVEGRFKGKPGIFERDEVDFIDSSPAQVFSAATNLIPFLEHDDANRALMGSNMQRQAVACIKPQAPLVSTGWEEKIAYDSGQVLVSDVNGKIEEVDGRSIKISSDKGVQQYKLRKFERSNQFTCVNDIPRVNVGQKVKKGDLLTDGAAVDNGVLSLGQNLLVGFLSLRGGVFEDAIIISDKILKGDRFTSIHVENFTCDVRETRLGSEITTADIPNVSEEKLRNLDEEGVIRLGAEVGPGDILVGKISPKGEVELTAEERLLRSIFGEQVRDVKDTSLVLEQGKRGKVVGVKILSRDQGDRLEPGIIKRISIEVAQLRKLSIGDKLAGRHGNKGVIAKILPQEEMPFLKDGTPLDIVLSPLGVPTRMNIGQILETVLGLVAYKSGQRIIAPSFAGIHEDDIRKELHDCNLPIDGKFTLYDGQTGLPFNDRITIGYIYMMKLNHLVEDKIHMRSIGPYSLITQQPLGGRAQFGGQRFGEMEVWALEGYGAAYVLQEMLTIKSDDTFGRVSTYEAIISNDRIKPPSIPAAFNVMVNELRGLGLITEQKRKPRI